jgi:protein-S-isoprenylcysteine O-methyltransferase Ste14
MADKGVNAVLLFAAVLVVVSAAALFLWPMGLLFLLINLLSAGMETLVLKFTRPVVLRRKIALENWWDRVLIPVIALLALAVVALSVYDVASAKISILPGWTFLLGIVVLTSAHLTLIQSVKAQPPHAMDKYGEAMDVKADRGPYDIVRHPAMLAVILGALAIPLIIGSGIGFVPAGLLLIAVVARVAMEDDWRFNNYDWYYDYTKEVSFRLVPFIW